MARRRPIGISDGNAALLEKSRPIKQALKLTVSQHAAQIHRRADQFVAWWDERKRTQIGVPFLASRPRSCSPVNLARGTSYLRRRTCRPAGLDLGGAAPGPSPPPTPAGTEQL